MYYTISTTSYIDEKDITCCSCKRIPKILFLIQGNIYVQDISTEFGRDIQECGGIIGNNFPLEKESFTALEIGVTRFCKRCLIDCINDVDVS